MQSQKLATVAHRSSRNYPSASIITQKVLGRIYKPAKRALPFGKTRHDITRDRAMGIITTENASMSVICVRWKHCVVPRMISQCLHTAINRVWRTFSHTVLRVFPIKPPSCLSAGDRALQGAAVNIARSFFSHRQIKDTYTPQKRDSQTCGKVIRHN